MAESSLAEKIRIENEGNKRINGHSPDYVARHLGEEKNELFSPEMKCLYIGDPWQKLDAKGVTIIDYEYGPVVEYRSTKKELKDRLNGQYWRAYGRMNWMEKHEGKTLEEGSPEDFLEKQRDKIEKLIARVDSAQLSEYKDLMEQFKELREVVEEEIDGYGFETDGEELSYEEERVVSLWYLATEGMRIIDIYDQKTVVGPQLNEYAKTLPKEMSPEERKQKMAEKKRELVETIRLKKTTKEANVAQAIFPELPFANKSFDRLVAYYSISTYVFPALDYEDFMKYWGEIDRVLNDGGRAYIGPLYRTDDEAYNASINDYMKEHQHIIFIDEDMPDIPPAAGMKKLAIYKVDLVNFERTEKEENKDEI